MPLSPVGFARASCSHCAPRIPTRKAGRASMPGLRGGRSVTQRPSRAGWRVGVQAVPFLDTAPLALAGVAPRGSMGRNRGAWRGAVVVPGVVAVVGVVMLPFCVIDLGVIVVFAFGAGWCMAGDGWVDDLAVSFTAM